MARVSQNSGREGSGCGRLRDLRPRGPLGIRVRTGRPGTTMGRMPEEQQQEFQRVDVRDYLQVLWRGKFIILITTVLVVSGAFFYSYLQENEYRSTREMVVTPRGIGEIVPGLGGSGLAAAAAATAVQLAGDELIFLGTEDLRDGVRRSARADPEGRVHQHARRVAGRLTSASGSSAEQVAEDANVYVEDVHRQARRRGADPPQHLNSLNAARVELGNHRRRRARSATLHDRRLPASRSPDRPDRHQTSPPTATRPAVVRRPERQRLATGATQIATASCVPNSPISPKPLNNALAAFGIGLVLGIALAFLREYLDDTIKTKDDVERASGLTVVGMIPQLGDWKDRGVAAAGGARSPTGPTAEAYRTLRTSIQFLGLERTIRTLLVTSPAASEGKSTTAANLAITFAHAGQRVVLLSSDFRRPRVHTFFGLSNQVGLHLGAPRRDAVLGGAADRARRALRHGAALGARPPNPSELLNSAAPPRRSPRSPVASTSCSSTARRCCRSATHS